jgi:hypothetical protein
MDNFQNTAKALFQFQDEYNIQKETVLQSEILFQTEAHVFPNLAYFRRV